jgi:hypothetical protein
MPGHVSHRARAALWPRVKVALLALTVCAAGVALVAPAQASAASRPSAHISIAGGYYPADSAWPWTTALIDPTRAGNDFDRNFCTAVLIAPQRVLTAAHCVVSDSDHTTPRPAAQFQALVGRRSLLNGSQGERHNVTGIAVHPKVYLPQSGVHQSHAFYDLAVLFLDTPSSITPAPIGTASDGSFGNGYATAMGWGHVNYDHLNPQRGPDLKAADFSLYDDSQCAYYFNDADQHYYPTIHVCAGDAPGGYLDCITHGDSGGPLMVWSGGAWKLIGITSFYPHGSGACLNAGPPFGFAWVAGPELSSWPLTVADPSPQGGGGGGNALNLSLSRRQVRRYIRTMIRDNTNGRIRHLRRSCSRTSYRSMRCRLHWRIRHRRFAGKGTFWHYEKNGKPYWTYLFTGKRRTAGCGSCTRRVSW